MIVRNAECGMRNGRSDFDSVFPQSLGFLHPPLSGDEILEQHHVLTAVQYYFDAEAGDRLSPPLIVDAPDLTGRFHASSVVRLSRFAVSDHSGPSVCVEFHLHPLWYVERTKPVGSHSALRTTVHSRSARSGARGSWTTAGPRRRGRASGA